MNICLYGILVVASFTDLKKYRIPNVLIVTGLVLSMVHRGICDGPPGLYKGILIFMTAELLLFPFYLIKALGAGDVKLFGVIAVYLGLRVTANIVVISILLGAVLGIAKYLMIQIKDESNSIFPDLKIHFSVCIALSVLTVQTGLVNIFCI